VSHNHLAMYLTSIKSLLRFYNNLSVVVHDDGTLKEQDKNILNNHIRNIKIIVVR
jgi:hypothetical protein